MAPRAQAPVKNAPTKNPPSRGDAPVKIPSTRGVKRKDKREKSKRKLKLKGWLETPADWAKFNAWAKINAQPRKIPEPEAPVRESKPLAQMKKRIEILSKPQRKSDTACRTDLGVSKKALTAKPSKRIKILAKFVEKKINYGREFPIKISRAALRYRATKRIIEISQPHEMPLSEQCKSLMEMTRDVASKKTVDRKTRLALVKKATQCPDLLTDEELDILITPTGIYRSALSYKFTPWMKYLSLPSYRFLKDQKGEKPTEWKEYILNENESRGKRALEGKRKKEEKKKKKEQEDASKLDEKQPMEVVNQKTDVGDEEKSTAEAESEEKTSEEEVVETEEKKDNEQVPESENELEEKNMENDRTAEAGDTGQDSEKKNVKSSRAAKKGEAGDTKRDEEDDGEAAKRKAARNAWRFAPPPCKDNPFAIKRSALKGKVSPRMAELAVRHIHEDLSCRKNPFGVRKSALTGPIPEGVSRLAKPNHPRDPIERPSPREKDSFGRPIYPMPPYGKKMPRIKPYEPADCPDKEKKDDDDKEKKEKKKSRFIDPIVYEPTVDPCIDPERSKRQIKARIAAKDELKRRKEAKDKSDEKYDEKATERSDGNENISPETENNDAE